MPLIVPDMTNPFHAELATTMTQAAGERGYQLVLCITNGDTDRAAGYLSACRRWHAPFVIVAPSTRVEIDLLEQFGLGERVVVIDRVGEQSTVPSVTVDNRRGIELAFDHLRSLATAGSATSRASQASTPPTSAWTRTASSPVTESIVLDMELDADAGARGRTARSP